MKWKSRAYSGITAPTANVTSQQNTGPSRNWGRTSQGRYLQQTRCWLCWLLISWTTQTRLHMGWQRNWQTSFAPWLASLHATLKTLHISYSTYYSQDWNQVRSWHHMMLRSSPHSSCGPFHTNSKTKTTSGPYFTLKDQHAHPTYHITGVLPQKHILLLPR